MRKLNGETEAKIAATIAGNVTELCNAKPYASARVGTLVALVTLVCADPENETITDALDDWRALCAEAENTLRELFACTKEHTRCVEVYSGPLPPAGHA